MENIKSIIMQLHAISTISLSQNIISNDVLTKRKPAGISISNIKRAILKK